MGFIFLWQCKPPKGFRANQGLLLAGAVAYYSLLSIVPAAQWWWWWRCRTSSTRMYVLLGTVGRYLNDLGVPGQTKPFVNRGRAFPPKHRDVVGGVLLVSMIFFSSLAFTVLENAMSVIFKHRVEIKRRGF